MLIVDNFDKVKNVVQWNPCLSYYKFVALIRTKDYKDGDMPVLVHKEKQEVFVRQWLVDNEEMFENVKNDMKTVTEMFRCRLYMTLDRMSTIKTLLSLRENVNKQLDQFLFTEKPQVSVRMFNKMISSATQLAESSDKECRRWMFDVDTKDEAVLSVVKKLCGEHYIETFETKNGFHVVANKKFDANTCLQVVKNRGSYKYLDLSQFSVEESELLKNSEVEAKSNSLILVAMAG